MNTDRLFEVLSAMHFLPADFREALERELTPVRYPKGHYLLQAHTVAYHSYFIDKGFAVRFQYIRNKRVVTNFWQAGEIILSPKSFFRQLPADEMIQLTTDSELLSISYASVVKLFEEYPVANLLARTIVTDYHTRSEERIVDLHTRDAAERHTKLLTTYPGIELHVSQDFIASYLNITASTLSRLRHKRD